MTDRELNLQLPPALKALKTLQVCTWPHTTGNKVYTMKKSFYSATIISSWVKVSDDVYRCYTTSVDSLFTRLNCEMEDIKLHHIIIQGEEAEAVDACKYKSMENYTGHLVRKRQGSSSCGSFSVNNTADLIPVNCDSEVSGREEGEGQDQSHPGSPLSAHLDDELQQMGSSFSHRIIPPRCKTSVSAAIMEMETTDCQHTDQPVFNTVIIYHAIIIFML